MPRPNTPEEREACINVTIDETRYRGRLVTGDVMNMFKLHRSTAEKYIREAVRKGNLIRHGPDIAPNLGVFTIMTNQQLIAAAEHAARYVPTATAQLIITRKDNRKKKQCIHFIICWFFYKNKH
ncbi:DUF977 family protein [Kosakonia sp. BYX6]|uniref:DUF977 family protein n=1 Tax=Kosakonia calanthes TaxID=3139408 RepID=A0ABZ3B0U0_9ENTR